MQSDTRVKRLVLRLSSLGDVILSTSCLETEKFCDGVDWVVAEEYAPVLRGHPRIRRLWEYQRKSGGGILSWYRFSKQLWNERYVEIYDFHGSIRTRLLRAFFFFWALMERRTSRGSISGEAAVETRDSITPRWESASKQRFRSWGFIFFKRLWPRKLLSRLQVEVFARTAGGQGSERPDLTHLINQAESFELPQELLDGQYVCVMPGSNWAGKTWAAEKYFALIQEVGFFPVVMGRDSDPESRKLVSLLESAELPFYSGVGKWSLPEVAKVLSSAVLTIGSDTGLALLSEAVGTEILVIYGPTAPGLGFEPWREGSRTVASDLWCRPCGKIGNRCYRPSKKYLCLKGLRPSTVIDVFRKRWLP